MFNRKDMRRINKPEGLAQKSQPIKIEDRKTRDVCRKVHAI
jgi:hypothetical protein